MACGDEIYIYVGSPVKAIKYRCKVIKSNLDRREIADTEFVINGEPYETFGNHMELELIEKYDDVFLSLDVLRERGMKDH